MDLENQTDSKYIHRQDVHNLKAPAVIVPYFIQLTNPKSVVDVGCGLATFLRAFKENGIHDILGIDGSWVPKEKLYIDSKDFRETDLEFPFQLNRKFDLVLCLEVAEHLKEQSAEILIKNLVSLGDIVVFSAAVPNQGGQNHVNEQEFAYWQKKFAVHGFSFYDVFREKYWNNPDIESWYKQNMFLVAKDTMILPEEIRKHKVNGDASIYIHPDTLAIRVLQVNTLTKNLKAVGDGNASIPFYSGAITKKLFNSIKKILGIKRANSSLSK